MLTPQDPRTGELAVELVPLADLRPHPRNYKDHPEEQIAHLVESIREHGVFRPILTARDGTILAGHGIARACGRIGMEEVPVSCLDLDPEEPRALKLLVADNESSRLAEDSDTDLAGLLQEIDGTLGLLGTGHTEESLAELMASLEEITPDTAPDAPVPLPPLTLAERFGVPPFSVLDARQGYWQDRKRQWAALGIQSELGRGEDGVRGEA